MAVSVVLGWMGFDEPDSGLVFVIVFPRHTRPAGYRRLRLVDDGRKGVSLVLITGGLDEQILTCSHAQGLNLLLLQSTARWELIDRDVGDLFKACKPALNQSGRQFRIDLEDPNK
ncbi:MAG: hypothetical protein DMF98_05960 [Acidobacteria bacterium]|nr:MAG: hypothetical protein DMF98_05960 [Acidobacteriota bacterium]